jgi:homoserine O-acetyltransferase
MSMRAASLALLIPSALACAPSQHVARLGDLRLQSGELIKDSVVGYRTRGQLNAARSNAVLVTPWYQGTSGQLARQIGPGMLVDSSKYFVIIVDAFGNGVSSSPSNSSLQPAGSFPVFTIADIVESQYQLVTRTFQLSHLHAVVGISMGGMQVFQWMTAHPDFIDKGVSIVGSPQSQPDDKGRSADVIRSVRVPAWTRARRALSRWQPRAALNELRIDPENYIRQAQAISTLDIFQSFGGSMERAAAAMRAELMVVSTWQDREVNPKPAFDFARTARADVLELDGRCGHQAPSCERATLWPAVARFLERGR